MKQSFFLRASLAVILLSSLNGCAETPSWWGNMPSWMGGDPAYHPPSKTAKGDIAPPPDAAPVAPVQQSQLTAPVFAVPAPSAAPLISPVAPAIPDERKVKVGILLPLTGPNAGLGHAMLNAAQQAVFDAAASNFELMPRDASGSPEAASVAAQGAIANGAQILIGPLFAPQIPSVAKIASAAHVPVLTLSTDTSQAAPGLYVMGFAPGAQAAQVAHYAISRGLKRFAALIPGNAYGTLVAQAFQLEVAKDGGTVVMVETYDPAKHDSDVQIRDLADKIGVIDALFLPEGGSDLALITKQLGGAGVDPAKIRMLGTGLWDAYDTGRVAPFVVGGWYAAPDPASRQGFIMGYKSTYSEEPPRLTTLAYDATALAAALAKRGSKFDQAAITNSNGFSGLDGIFRLKPNGEVERGLAILEVTALGSDVVDSAPPSFVGH